MDGYNLESRVKSLEVLTSLLLAITQNMHTGVPAPMETLKSLLNAHPDILTEDLLSYLNELESTAELLKSPTLN
ncbi:hypothetical protein [Amphritea balenae]|uniref:Uncharacterized protein n=1 Tax=Amphritea balenae TaxID=452629 RepID=A0A3P1SV01_9GAMM|nr:hypothetical protein [Amphritea balenae]RRD01044.1 hypothetical protein EHS89_00305 [Amphritea balenae]GGK60433.1 hypothetical protein GCM10007941_08370 [Amphritea balenae]